MAENREVLLITGAGSGMGMESALFLAAHKYRVFGTVLTAAEGESLGSEAARRGVTVSILRMDVTKPREIEAALGQLLEQTGRLDGLVHFAGLGLRGFFEDLDMQEIRGVFEVNLFGAMMLTQQVLPHMRLRQCGRIVFVSSAAGRIGAMSISSYASSKFAVEGLAECLWQEVRPFNIHVSLLEPGLINTPHFTVNRNRARRAVDPSGSYYLWFCQHEKLVDKTLARTHFTTADVAKVVYRILTARRPRLRYVVGSGAKLVLRLRALLPGEWFERFYWGIVRRKVTRPRAQATTLSQP